VNATRRQILSGGVGLGVSSLTASAAAELACKALPSGADINFVGMPSPPFNISHDGPNRVRGPV